MEFPDVVRSAFDAAPCCFLATCHEGVPNVVPVAHKWIVGNELLLADMHFGKTRRNIADNAEVAVSVTGPQPKQGFQLKGSASIHRSGDLFEKLKTLLQAEGVEAEPHAAVRIPVAEIYLLHPGPDAGRQIL